MATVRGREGKWAITRYGTEGIPQLCEQGQQPCVAARSAPARCGSRRAQCRSARGVKSLCKGARARVHVQAQCAGAAACIRAVAANARAARVCAPCMRARACCARRHARQKGASARCCPMQNVPARVITKARQARAARVAAAQC